MRSDDILDAIGEVDDDLVRGAKEIRRSHKALWLTLSSVAACLLIVFMLPIVFISMKGASSADPGSDGKEEDISSISIYYLGEDGIAVEQTEWLSIQEVFNTWRDLNGLGEDVRFISQDFIVSTDDPVTVSVVHLVISDDIENYYDSVDKKLLLETLTLTMTEYFDVSEEHFILRMS